MNMQTRLSTLVILGVILCIFSPVMLNAAQAAEEKPKTELYRIDGRPKVGLVLSGGGARGVAHVGVLKVLEELHVPVDFIAGTSMAPSWGSLCCGMSPTEMEERIQAIDWESIFTDNPARQDIPWRRKQDDFTSLFASNWVFETERSFCPWGRRQATSSSFS